LSELNDPGLLDHSTIEETAYRLGWEVLRQAIEDKLQKVAHHARRKLAQRHRFQKRLLETRVGTVTALCPALLQPGSVSLRPLDAVLNLPREKYSFPFQKLLCQEIGHRAYDEALESLEKQWPGHIPKRQALEIICRRAQDFEAFYRLPTEPTQAPLLVGSLDGSGVVMRPEGLRPETRKKAEKKLKNRQGKRSHKRQATVAAVYEVEPFFRSFRESFEQRPVPQNKRVWASLERSPEEVTRELFEEMRQRDPTQQKHWVILVDGDPHQLDRIAREAERLGVEVTVILDVVHVLEYLWKAAWCFYDVGSEMAREFVTKLIDQIVAGQAAGVADALESKRKRQRLKAKQYPAIAACAQYLRNHLPWLHYERYLAQGLPIATGVIEGACRYLVKDRMDRTGSRWGLSGAEAVLKLRALLKAGDFEAYWDFHLEQERWRNYAAIPPESTMVSCLQAA
jgi:hypothetical protein